jgi:hypothetical protein
MKRIRKKHYAAFKAKVALAAVSGERTSGLGRRGKRSRSATPIVHISTGLRKAGKCSPSPTYPQAPQPTKDLILMK